MLPVNGVNDLLYLPAPGQGVHGPEPRAAVFERGRFEAPPREARARGAEGQAAGRGRVGYRPNERSLRAPRDAGHLVLRASDPVDDNAGGAFSAQTLAQESARPGLFIDRSAEAAQAYGARAGFAAHRAATGGNLNIAV